MGTFQRVLDEGFIIHASGNPAHKVVYGFYLYTFRDKSKDGKCLTSCS